MSWPLRSFSLGLAPSPPRRRSASAFSMSVSTSPMPRMRLAIRSGWNGSKSSSFSPGAGEEDRLADDFLHRQRGATARVAVDLGEDHAGEPDGLVELGRRRSPLPGRSWRRRRAACRAAAPRRAPRAARPSARRRSGDGRRCRRSRRRDRGAPPPRAPPRATATGSVGSENTGTPTRSPSTRSCSTAAGRWRSAPTSSGRRPWLFRSLASLADGGRLPGALEAGQHHDGRRLRPHRELAGGAAEGLDQLLVDDLDDLLRRAQALRDLRAARRVP